jgi:general secretion pathway protein J
VTHSTRSAGFTLIELLVATTLLALLSVILFGGLRFGARAWDAGGQSMERTGEIESVQELLRRTLAEAAVPEPLGAAKEQPSVIGNAEWLGFYAPLPRHIGTGGLGRYHLLLDGDGRLQMAWEPRRPERPIDAPTPASPEVILRQVRALKLSYYGRAGSEDAPSWHENWNARALPLLIRVEVGFTKEDRRTWPDLIIAPRLAKSGPG